MTQKPSPAKQTKQPSKGKQDYAAAGVDIDKGDALVDWLGQQKGAASTPYGSTLEGIGGFAGLFKPDLSQFTSPVLVGATDGVGTKVTLGLESSRFEGLGVDLVAMCANDLITLGAKPLFFLDYYASGKLEEDIFRAILTGIRRGVEQSQAVLLGGETAEMPGVYQNKDFDLAGFMVGMVDEPRILGSKRVQSGDTLIGLRSQGFHSNGYSLIRHWLKKQPHLSTPALIEQLMQPTLIYGALPKVVDACQDAIHAMAHITGGGISGNLTRILPEGAQATITAEKIPTPEWMRSFIEASGGSFAEHETVFNWGVGMILAVDAKAAPTVLEQLACYQPVELGEIQITGETTPAQVVYT